MQHRTVEPGTVLAGRYRVEDLLSDTVGSRCWRALDEVLARSVAVHVLPASDPRAGPLLEAARRSSMVPDGRFVRVLDAAEEAGSVYVVREWVSGDTLAVVLQSGPLAPRRAAWIARECAAAMAAAHEVGIPHLRLVPANVILTGTGGVKLLGLATDAALYDLTSPDPQADDVHALGALLYACLVARWPASGGEGLPAAPREAGRLLRPRQVRAGVPRTLDQVCERILGPGVQSSAEPLRTAAQVNAALTAALSALADPEATVADSGAAAGAMLAGSGTSQPDATVLLPRPGSGTLPPAATGTATHDDATPVADVLPHVAHAVEPPEPDRAVAAPRSRRGKALVWVAVAALALGAAVLAYEIGRRGGAEAIGPGDPTTATTRTSPSTRTTSAAPLAIAAVSDFDPVADGGTGEENAAEVPLATDGDPTTAWETVEYHNNPALGGLKPGVGLLLDLGEPARVSSVRLRLIGTGTNVELRAAPEATDVAPATAGEFETFAQASQADERVTLRPRPAVRTRYLLIYLTSLPQESPARYQGRVAEVSVFG